jgi:hypothetical protein
MKNGVVLCVVAVAMIDAGKTFCQSLPRNIYMEVLNVPWLFDLEQSFLNLPAILISLFRISYYCRFVPEVGPGNSPGH